MRKRKNKEKMEMRLMKLMAMKRLSMDKRGRRSLGRILNERPY
jgi:hypothetical protein